MTTGAVLGYPAPMMLQTLRSLLVFAPLLLVACAAEVPEGTTPSKDAPKAAAPDVDSDAPPAAASDVAVYDVKCGCSIDSVGHCGNFIMIGDNYIPMLHPDLGKMEWCRQKAKGAKVEASGAVKDGKFVATAWKTVE